MSQEIAGAYQYMTMDMGGKLSNYYHSLQARFGDPAVYAMQREQMAAQVASVQYSEAKTREEALRSAYDKQRVECTNAHQTRMSGASRTRRPQSDPPADPPPR